MLVDSVPVEVKDFVVCDHQMCAPGTREDYRQKIEFFKDGWAAAPALCIAALQRSRCNPRQLGMARCNNRNVNSRTPQCATTFTAFLTQIHLGRGAAFFRTHCNASCVNRAAWSVQCDARDLVEKTGVTTAIIVVVIVAIVIVAVVFQHVVAVGRVVSSSSSSSSGRVA